MTKKTLTIVSELFYPEDSSTSYVMSMIANHLKKKHNVRVITGPEFYGKMKVEDTKTFGEGFDENLEIIRTKAFALNKNKLLQRTLRQLLISFSLAYKIIRNVKRQQFLLVVTNPQFLILFLSFFPGIKNRYKLDILVHDVFPENLVSAGLIKSDSFIYKMLCKLYNRAYQKANRLIVVGRDMELIMQKKVKHKNILVISNWAQVDNLLPESRDKNSLIDKLNLKEKLILQFAGNFGRVQGLEFILKIANELEEAPIHFLFAGSGAMKERMTKMKQELNLENVTILGRYKRSEQQEILNASDIGIVSLSKNMVGLGVPSKSYNIMAVGNPIFYIGEKESEIALMIEEHEIGWVIESGDMDKAKTLLNDLVENKGKVYNKGKKARLIAENFYSEKVILEKFESLYE